MKRAAALLLACACVTVNKPLAPDRPSGVSPNALYVHGKALFRDTHCGGKATTPDASEKLRRPAATTSLRLSVGRENLPVPAAAIVLTDSEGRFDAWLEPNTYCVVLSTRSREGGSLPAPPETLAGHTATPECLKALESVCDGELIVGEGQTEVWADLVGKSCTWSSPCAAKVEAPPAAAVP